MQRVYQLYATTSQANAANVQILSRGRITGVLWACTHAQTAGSNLIQSAELSFQATSQLSTNNPLGIISAVSNEINIVTSGGTNGGINVAQPGINITVDIGTLLYLNTSLSASTGTFKVLVYVEES